MIPTFRVEQTRDDGDNLRRLLRSLTDSDVYIGIPQAETSRDPEQDDPQGINNAYLGYIHEHGVPENNLPARPHLIPGIVDIQGEAAKHLERAATLVLGGDMSALADALKKIGLLGQNAVRARFVNNDWPALSDRTLDYEALQKDESGNVLTDKKGKAKRKKSRRERKRVNPLIDTSQLRKSYTYVIRQRGGQGLIVI